MKISQLIEFCWRRMKRAEVVMRSGHCSCKKLASGLRVYYLFMHLSVLLSTPTGITRRNLTTGFLSLILSHTGMKLFRHNQSRGHFKQAQTKSQNTHPGPTHVSEFPRPWMRCREGGGAGNTTETCSALLFAEHPCWSCISKPFLATNAY